jgi:hypothetical protein
MSVGGADSNRYYFSVLGQCFAVWVLLTATDFRQSGKSV